MHFVQRTDLNFLVTTALQSDFKKVSKGDVIENMSGHVFSARQFFCKRFQYE